ncbi:hypothetical protein POTOM_000923 [Populus tomentosa]|uniref:Inhibitor I9 domain-containing protein n=1 Tax=Populus tomentosa TaxID=118781 RepID=A0A8X8DGY4_POPTO|nr:hypothetical protein POTOM_000923 [Populus tomentosa]
MVYSYRNIVTGFAAELTAEEAKAVEDKDGFLSAMELCVTTKSLVQEIPFHQKRHHHLTMKAMGLTRPAQQLEIFVILTAMDAAVEDGMGVLSLSLGGGSAPIFEDSMAGGALEMLIEEFS